MRTALEHKYGSNSDIVETIKKLEEKPDSKSRQSLVQEEISNAKADQDPELPGKLNQLPSARVSIDQDAKIKGDRNTITGQGDVSISQ